MYSFGCIIAYFRIFFSCYYPSSAITMASQPIFSAGVFDWILSKSRALLL